MNNIKFLYCQKVIQKEIRLKIYENITGLHPSKIYKTLFNNKTIAKSK